VNGGSNSGITSAFKFALQDTPDFNYATFLTNHDQNRVMSVFDGDVEKAKAVATLLLTSPGTPFLYYGEEIGMQGQKPDEDIRLPMQWTADANAGFTTGTPWRAPAPDYEKINVAAQDKNPDSLLNHYRQLIKLRRENAALRDGNVTLLETGKSGVYAVLRSSGEEKILVIVNLRGTPIADYALSLKGNLLTNGTVTPHSLFGKIDAAPATITEGGFSQYKPVEELLPYGSYLFQLK
jgi:glycosidase